MAALDTLTDTFNSQDAAKWTFAAGAVVANGQLTITPTASYPQAVSVNTYDFTSSYAKVQLVGLPNAGNGTIQTYMTVAKTTNVDEYNFQYDGSGLTAAYKAGGVQTVVTYAAYDSSNQKWLRIRENGGVVVWETSASGLVWNTYGLAATQFTHTGVTAYLGSGFYGTEPAPGTFVVDNFNFVPGSVTYVATDTPAAVGTTTSASTVGVTPVLPTGTAVGDRVFVIQAGNNTNGGTPTSWTALSTDVQVGPTGSAPGAGTGRRYLSVFYRDYDGVWTMPAFTLTSATQNTNACSAITLRKSATDSWDAPAASTAGNTSSATTSYSVTTGSVASTGGMVLIGTATNDNVTASAQTLTNSGMTLANLAERSDTGSATGNDVSIKTYTAETAQGGTGTFTHAATLSGASEGGSVAVVQTSTSVDARWPLQPFAVNQAALVRANSW